MKIGLIGGDLRQLTLLEKLKTSNEVYIYGYDGLDETVNSLDELRKCNVLILPMPSCKGEFIYAPKTEYKIHISDLDLDCFEIIFYCGGNEILNSKLVSSRAVCVNYLNDEALILKNAIPTAEGALEIAMRETNKTIFKSKVLVTGFGRVAKAAARVFDALGAEVCICARRDEALIEAQCLGYKSSNICSLKNICGEYDVIINTVPVMIFDSEILSCVKNHTLIIDLASLPGGVDLKASELKGIKTIFAPGLPGKVAPVSAGNIIYDTIQRELKEREVTDCGA